MALITYDDAVRHLKLDGAEPDQTDLQLKMEQATAIVVGFIDRADHGWTQETDAKADPEFAIAQGFIFKVLQRLERFRGDDEKHAELLSQEEQQLLANLLKEPGIA